MDDAALAAAADAEKSVTGMSPLTVADCPATSSMLPVMVSVASLVGCIYVIVTFCYVRALRQHPAGIMFGMSVYGAVYQFLYLLDRSSLRVDCSRMGIFVDFFLTGQETYMLLFAIDLLLALKNPFSAPKGLMKQYHVFGGLWSLVCATIAHFDTHYALFGFCWMSSSDDHLNLLRTVVARAHQNQNQIDGTSETANAVDAASNGTLTSGIFFALYIVVVYCTSLAALLRSWNTLAKGLPDTFLTRRRIHRHLKYYVGCYFGYWTLVLSCYVLFSLMPRDATDHAGGGVRCRIWHLLKCLLLAKGMVCSLIWTRTSNILTIIEQLREFGYVDLPPHEDSINWALRLEILTKTTAGICAAVDEAEKNAAMHAIDDGGDGNDQENDNETYERRGWYSHVEKIVLEYRTDHRLRRRNGIHGFGASHSANASASASASVPSGNDTTNDNTPSSSMGVVFKDFAPQVFRRLRHEANISTASYRQSLQQTTKERVSEGKSGAFFYFTEDRKYVVKTLADEERRFLLQILPLYFAFVKRHPNTFMTRFFGCHGVTMYGKTVYFVVMQSVFDSALQIHERFDLKGSWVGRLEGRKPSGTVADCKFCKTEFVVGGSHGQLCHVRRGGDGNWRHQYDQVGKDLNWNRHMALPTSTARAVAIQLIHDSTFLCRVNCIDYSLLVGIHHRSFNVSHYSSAEASFVPEAPVTATERPSWGSSAGGTGDRASVGSSSAASGVSHSVPMAPPLPPTKPFHQAIQGGMSVDEVHGPGVYFMGLIDMLQPWNLRKRIEHFLRVYVCFQDRNGISVVNPRTYAERFQQRVVHELIYDGRHELLQQHEREPLNGANNNNGSMLYPRETTATQLRPTRLHTQTQLSSIDSSGGRSTGAAFSTILESNHGNDVRYDSTVLLERVSSSYLSPPQHTPIGLPLRVSARMAATSGGGSGVLPSFSMGGGGGSSARRSSSQHQYQSHPHQPFHPRPRASTVSTIVSEHSSQRSSSNASGPRLSGGLVMELPPGGSYFAAPTTTTAQRGGRTDCAYQPIAPLPPPPPSAAGGSSSSSYAMDVMLRRPLVPMHLSSLGRTDSAGSLGSGHSSSDGSSHASSTTTLSPPKALASVVPLFGSSAATSNAGVSSSQSASTLSASIISSSGASALHSISAALVGSSGSSSPRGSVAVAVTSPMTIETGLSYPHHSYQIVHTPTTLPDKSSSSGNGGGSTMSA